MKPIIYAIMTLGVINSLRLALFMVCADLYELREQLRRHKPGGKSYLPYNPRVTVVIPAFNEELCIIRTLESVLVNDYDNKEVIVVDDGSTDSTLGALYRYALSHNAANVTIVHQENAGKATAINNGIKNHATGELVMVLDADSILHPAAISRMATHFRDPQIVAAAANVKVIDSWRPLAIAQRLEYVISHRMKRALTVLNMEYIIGGVGSTFRRSMVEACNYYDTDTMTEDIDFTMKLINQKGNRANKVIFAADVISYTEGVTKFGSLIRQRFRWKYGRMQTFYKNRNVFFSRDKKHGKKLSWGYLPFVVLSELLLLLDPLITCFVLYLAFAYGGLQSFFGVYLFVSMFSLINILSEGTEPLKSKLRLALLTPFAYWLLIVMSFVDFIVLVQSVIKLPALLRGKNWVSHWQHVERTGGVVKLDI